MLATSKLQKPFWFQSAWKNYDNIFLSKAIVDEKTTFLDMAAFITQQAEDLG